MFYLKQLKEYAEVVQSAEFSYYKNDLNSFIIIWDR